jgi:hypothetical protein
MLRKKKKKKRKKKKKKEEKKLKAKRKKEKEKKRRVPRRAISAGHRDQEHTVTPHAINGLVELKKESFPPSSTTPCELAYTGSRARNNGCARVACVQSLTCASANMQECACIIQSNGLCKHAATGAGSARRQRKVKESVLGGRGSRQENGTWGGERA